MSHALRVGVADQIGYFRAYNTDGSAKTDLTSSTTGLTLSVFRVGASAVSISSLSAKAADNTAHADGAIRAVSGNLYTVDLPDAACADQVPSISVKGSYTGGVIEGPEHPLVGYNPASVAVGANTTTPPTVAAIADQVWDEARSGHITAGTFGEKVNAELDSSVTAQLDDIESDTTAALSYLSSITSAISAIAAIFTGMTSLPNWLRRAWRKDAGTAGMSTAQTEINTGGTATFAGTTDSQEAIKDALGSSGGGPAYSAAVVAARLPVGSAAGWPQEILCGAAYLTELGTHISLYVKDVDENILAAMGDKTFADGDFKAILRLSPLTDANKLLAQPAATIEVDSDDTPWIVFNDDTSGEEYFELQIPKAKTALGEIRTRYLCQVILRWGDGSEYEWIVNLGESKFIRGVSAAA